MAVKRLVRRNPGGNSSAGNKIVAVNNKLGFQNMGNQQGSTRVIYDAVPLATTTTNTTLTLFENCKTRSFPLTNLTENKLQIGESMAFERFSFYIIETTSGTTNALAILPLNYFLQLSRIYAGWMSFSIAQDQVIKKLPLSGQFAPFNKDSKFFGSFQIQPTAADPITQFSYPHDVYYTDNNLVIPQQIEFRCDVTIPPITVPSGFDFYLAMKIEGLGSLYAPQSNY